MIKIALVIPTLDQSGAEKQLALLATRLPKDQFDVHVVVLTRGGFFEQELRAHDIPLTILNKRWKFDPFALRRLSGLLKELQPQIVHSWLFAANAYTRLIGGARPTWKTVISERCVDSWKARWQTWLDRWMIARTDQLVGNSQSVIDFYSNLGFPAEKTCMIPNGIRIPEKQAAAKKEILSELQLPDQCRLVGYVGRLAEQKRIKDLLWAIQLARQVNPDIRLIIVGDGPLRARLEDYAHEVETAEFVRFVGHRNDASRFFQAFDVFWLASEFEGMSNSVMEAMAAGVPVVASDIPPNRELIEHGQSGFLIKVGDSVGFSQFTLNILGDADLANRIGTTARHRMETNFSIDQMVSKYIDLYHQLVVDVPTHATPANPEKV